MTLPLFASLVGGLLVHRHLAGRRRDATRFLATVSHELRTPLNAIVGWVSLLKSGRLRSDEMAHALDCIERNVQLETRLVDELLEASRLLGGRSTITFAPIDFRSAVEAALERVAPIAGAKGVELAATCAPVPLPVSGDERRLTEAVGHVVLNAVKFTAGGGEVHVSLERRGNQACLHVADTGEGIAAGDLLHILEPFQQGHTRTRRSGLGLGLAVVRQLVELHGGTISAHSAGRGRGAAFRILLPLLSSQSDSRETTAP